MILLLPVCELFFIINCILCIVYLYITWLGDIRKGIVLEELLSFALERRVYKEIYSVLSHLRVLIGEQRRSLSVKLSRKLLVSL